MTKSSSVRLSTSTSSSDAASRRLSSHVYTGTECTLPTVSRNSRKQHCSTDSPMKLYRDTRIVEKDPIRPALRGTLDSACKRQTRKLGRQGLPKPGRNILADA